MMLIQHQANKITEPMRNHRAEIITLGNTKLGMRLSVITFFSTLAFGHPNL